MNIERLSLDQLRVFVQVADSGSFLAAARKLSRAQSAVSYAIATLEDQLGVLLFDRSGYRPQLTSPGVALLADARQVLDHVDSLQVRANSYARGQELEVSLAVDVFFPTDCLVDLLQRFRVAFPAVTVRLEVEALGAVAERVIDGRSMLGILGTLPTTPPNLLRITLPSVQLVEMGHDGPAHITVSNQDPLLRGLGTYHGKRGWGVSVEFDVKHGPVTLLGLGQDRDGSLSLIASTGTVVRGPLLQIGNTTSRVDFDRDPGEWVDAWSASGVGHHWSLSVGDRVADYRAAASLLDIDFRQV